MSVHVIVHVHVHDMHICILRGVNMYIACTAAVLMKGTKVLTLGAGA